MEYAYATCILNETGEEINEENLTDVLEAAGCSVIESRVKAIVAALEDVDVGEVTAVDPDDIGGESPQNPDRDLDRDQDVPAAEDETEASETEDEHDPTANDDTDLVSAGQNGEPIESETESNDDDEQLGDLFSEPSGSEPSEEATNVGPSEER